MSSSGSRRAALAAAAATAALALGLPSCTSFNGLVAAGADARPSASADAGARDAEPGSDAGSQEDVGVPDMLLALDVSNACFPLCVEWAAGPLPPSHVGIDQQREMLRCIASASSCNGAGRCTWFDYGECSDQWPCADAGEAIEYCDGKTLRDEEAGTWSVQHCDNAFLNREARCLETDAGMMCGIAGCATGVTAEGLCVGNVLYQCLDGQTVVENCALSGSLCDSASCMMSECTVAGSQCVMSAVAVCDSEWGTTMDCQEIPAVCEQKGNHARCAPLDAQCSSFDSEMGVCTGSSIALCLAGKPEAFDCASIGQKCIPGDATRTGRCGYWSPDAGAADVGAPSDAASSNQDAATLHDASAPTDAATAVDA